MVGTEGDHGSPDSIGAWLAESGRKGRLDECPGSESEVEEPSPGETADPDAPHMPALTFPQIGQSVPRAARRPSLRYDENVGSVNWRELTSFALDIQRDAIGRELCDGDVRAHFEPAIHEAREYRLGLVFQMHYLAGDTRRYQRQRPTWGWGRAQIDRWYGVAVRIVLRVAEVGGEVLDLIRVQQVLVLVGEAMEVFGASVQLIGEVSLPEPMGAHDLPRRPLAGGRQREAGVGGDEPARGEDPDDVGGPGGADVERPCQRFDRGVAAPFLGRVEMFERVFDGDAQPKCPARAKTLAQSPTRCEDDRDNQRSHREDEDRHSQYVSHRLSVVIPGERRRERIVNRSSSEPHGQSFFEPIRSNRWCRDPARVEPRGASIMRAETRTVLAGGLFAGLLGYVVVVVVMAVLNVVAGRSAFYTAAMFGSAIFYGLEDPAALQIAPGPVLAYNMLHVLAFLALGLLTSWLVAKAEAYPIARFVILFVLIFVAAHVYGAGVIFAQPLLGPSAWWELGVGSVAAAVAMGWYLLRLHPALRRGLREIPMGEEVE